MTHRSRVLGLLSLLSVITYLDRVCISVAGPRMQDDLGIDPVSWGWVTGAFTLSYALFEIPSGSLGDRLGPRLVLTRIVLWWSAFTALTGAVSRYWLLVLARFLFGMGEAGAYPNIGVALMRWFPLKQRSSAWGIVIMAAQLGGALAPFLVVPIQARFGWRASFFVFGAVGVLWTALWYWWFRDSPAQMPGASQREIDDMGDAAPPHHGIPFGLLLRSSNMRALMAAAACAGYSLYFFQSWFGTYLVRARGFTETGLLLTSLPFLTGAVANFTGGYACDALARRVGLRWGRRALGMIGYGGTAVFVALTLATKDPAWTIVWLSLAYGGLTFAQPSLMTVCLDIGGKKYGGAATGAMNTAAYAFGFLSSVIYGYLVERYDSYDVPFIPMAVLMTFASLLWLGVDAERELEQV